MIARSTRRAAVSMLPSLPKIGSFLIVDRVCHGDDVKFGAAQARDPSDQRVTSSMPFDSPSVMVAAKRGYPPFITSNR